MTDDDRSAPVAETATSVSAPEHSPPRQRVSAWKLMLPIAVFVVLVDQLTKSWAVDALSDGRARHVIWTLQWNLSFNSGMAFSKGQGVGPIIGLLAVVVVVFIAVSVRHTDSRVVLAAAGFVMGGALGNLVDRVFRGEGGLHGSVIDFIDFQWFPIFNVADIGVNVGGGLFILWSLFSGRHQEADS